MPSSNGSSAPAPDRAGASPFAWARLPRAALWERPWLCVLLLLAAALISYAPALGGDFLWDDEPLVKHNGLIRSPALTWEIFQHPLFAQKAGSVHYRPVQTLLFAGEYWAWGLDPFGFHLVNVCLHAGAGCLLFLLLRRLLPRLLPATLPEGNPIVPAAPLAFVLALVWTVHPVHNAAVAYVSGCADSLAVFLVLLGWLSWEHARASTGAWSVVHGGAAACCLLLACGAKELAAVWPALLGLSVVFSRASRPLRWRKLMVPLAGCLLVLAAGMALRHHAGIGLGAATLTAAGGSAPPVAPPARPELMLRALGDYAGLLLFPARLRMDREVFRTSPEAAEWPYHLLSVGGVLALAALAAGTLIWRAPGVALRRFGAAWFLVSYLPLSNLFPLNATVAEHWLYVPSIGFLLFAAGVWCGLERGGWPRRALTWGTLGLAVPLLMTRTAWRSADWAEPTRFFQQTMSAGGGSVESSPRAAGNLAVVCLQRGETACAVSLLRSLLERYPRFTFARVQLAAALSQLGQTREGAGLFRAVLAGADNLDPGLLVATLSGLSLIPVADGGLDPAAMREATAAALARFPDAWPVVRLRAETLTQYGPGENARDDSNSDIEQARTLVSSFVSRQWWNYDAALFQGKLEERTGNFPTAISAYERAGRLDCWEAAAWQRRAVLCLRAGQLEQALICQRTVVRHQPADSEARRVLAVLLARSEAPPVGKE